MLSVKNTLPAVKRVMHYMSQITLIQKELHDLYLKSDVLLSADVCKKLR